MAVRKSERRKLRRQLISRTARIWSKLNTRLNRDLIEITQSWLKKLIKQAENDIASGDVSNAPDIPEKFIKVLQQTLREALAYGYWLQELYLYEIRGKKYKGKITLSEGDDVKELLQDFIYSGEWNDVIPEDAVNWINNYVPKLAGVLSQDVLEKTRDVIRNSLLEGSTLKERIKALQEAAPELAAMTQHRLEAIARTEITRADTLGRLAAMKANDDVIGVEFSAIMDDRTTEICASRHGLVMRLDDPRLAENTPPLHVNCRSMLISLTVYDYPDGLFTSHEFDEIPVGIQRPEDIEEVKKILQVTVAPKIPDIDLTSMPEKIEGTKEEQAKIFEQIDKFYKVPNGAMNEYHVEVSGKHVDIHFDNNYLIGEDTSIELPSGKKASKAEREGAIKYAIYQHRPQLELSASSRRDGFATIEMAIKWGGRLLSDAEKAQVDEEIEEHIQRLFNSPMSEEGKKLNELYWKKEQGGWRRLK